MANTEADRYTEFWKEHGKIFKLGYSDFQNREKFSQLLRFNSSHQKDESETTSLDDYMGRSKTDQKEIYYIHGATREAINSDPHLEIFKDKGLEVLYLYDPADEFIINSIGKYKEFEFKSVDQVDLSKIEKFNSQEKETKKTEELSEDDEKHFDSLLSRIKEILGDSVTEVRISKRLKDSPACLVNPDNTISSTMQKIMHIMQKDASIPKKILEINKDHKLVRNLLKVYKKDSKDPYITAVTEQLFESSLLLEGYLTDPHKLVNRINSLLEDSSDWYTTIKNL